MKKSLADEAEVHLKFSAKVTPPHTSTPPQPLWAGLTHGVLLGCEQPPLPCVVLPVSML